MVNSILETYKIENNGIRLNIERNILTGEFLAGCIDGLKTLCNSAGIEINFHNDAPGLCADFDKLLIKRVINNLITNAVSHSNTTDKIDVYLSLTGDTFSIDVVDYGEGIDEAEIQKIFNKYYSITNKARTVSGLGLYLSNKIVKNIKAVLKLNPERGEAQFSE